MIASTSEREARAELEVLRDFHSARIFAGHDFGGGQRRAEIIRRERELGVHAWDDLDLDLTADELRAAFERVGRPKVRRIERESYRRQTPATTRTLVAWRLIEGRLR